MPEHGKLTCAVPRCANETDAVHACNADESDGQRLLTLIVLVRYTCMCNDTSVYFSSFFPSFFSFFL